MLRKYIFQMNDAIAMEHLRQNRKANDWLSICYDYSRDVLTQTTMIDDEQNLVIKDFLFSISFSLYYLCMMNVIP